MPREERIEAILAAWYELVTCEPSERARIAGMRCSTRPLLARAPADKSYWKPLGRGSRNSRPLAERNTQRGWPGFCVNLEPRP